MSANAATSAHPDSTGTNGSDHSPQLQRLRVVMARTGKSRSGIYEDPDFPKPVKIGPRCVAWPSHEIDAWIQARIADRDNAAQAVS